MHRLKNMKECLMACVQGQMSNLSQVDTHELGAAVDMIKDLSEAIYYCTITEAMEEKEEDKNHSSQMYMMYPKYPDYSRDMDKPMGRMYYDGKVGVPGENTRDYREGRSPVSRKMYMESKELHHGKEKQMKDLENYIHELSQDITEMIQDASPEEKQLLQQKISMLASKIK